MNKADPVIKYLKDNEVAIIAPTKHSLRRINSILNSVLDNINIEAGNGLYFVFDRCDFSDDLGILCRETKGVYGERFQYETKTPHKEINAVIDSALLIRLLENLISNAFKYGSPNENVTLMVDDRDTDISLSVHNLGEPIPRDKQDNIFKFLSTTKGNSGQRSYGIGLALAKAIAEAHKGTINLESTKEQGTTFTLTIPKHFYKPTDTFTVTI